MFDGSSTTVIARVVEIESKYARGRRRRRRRPSAAGARLEQSGAASLRNHLERAALLRDAIDAASFPVEHEDVLRCYGNVGEARRTLVGRERNRRQDAARDQLKLVHRRRSRPAGCADDPQVALDRVNLERRNFVEARVDAGEARHVTGPLSDHEQAPVIFVPDDEPPGDGVVREPDCGET